MDWTEGLPKGQLDGAAAVNCHRLVMVSTGMDPLPATKHLKGQGHET